MASVFLAAAMALVGVLAFASAARADALVVVKVQGEGAPDGTVTLTARRGGQAYSCRTRAGECRINGVPGGTYRVEFRPASGPTPGPRAAMIPPSGTVTLFVGGRAGR